MTREPMRGEVWDVLFPSGIGRHPAVVLSVNRLNAQLGTVIVLLITGTEGPPETHVRIGPDAGVTKYEESFVNVTDMHQVTKDRFRNWRGRVDPPTEMVHIAELVVTYLGLADYASPQP